MSDRDPDNPEVLIHRRPGRTVRTLGLLLVAGFVASVIGATATVHAQQTSQSDNVARLFFHPRLVMANAQRIELTEDQRQAIQAAVEESQEEFRRQRFELQNAMTVLAAEAVRHPVDAAEILDRLTVVLEIEDRIKQTQLLMLVRVKNLLTPEQHVALDEARRRARQNAQQRPRPQP